MIQNPFANMPPVVKNLLIINIICFIPVLLFDHGASGPNPIADTFGVFYFNASKFRLWQIISYMFIHGSFWHIMFNMIALISFGPIIEQAMGSKRFLNFYFICGVGAIAFQLLVQAYQVHAITGHFTITNPDDLSTYNQFSDVQAQKLYDVYHTGMVGASGAIFGVLIAVFLLFPNVEVYIYFIPIPVKIKYLVPLYVLFELYSGLMPSQGDSVAHFAHIGGALVGFIVIKLWGYSSRDNFY